MNMATKNGGKCSIPNKAFGTSVVMSVSLCIHSLRIHTLDSWLRRVSSVLAIWLSKEENKNCRLFARQSYINPWGTFSDIQHLIPSTLQYTCPLEIQASRGQYIGKKMKDVNICTYLSTTRHLSICLSIQELPGVSSDRSLSQSPTEPCSFFIFPPSI